MLLLQYISLQSVFLYFCILHKYLTGNSYVQGFKNNYRKRRSRTMVPEYILLTETQPVSARGPT